MNLQYYRGELTGKRRILKALSRFQKGEIDIEQFVDAYQTILLEEHLKSVYPQHYTEEGMKLMGLEKRDYHDV